MKRLIANLMLGLFLATAAFSTSYLYLEQSKAINGSFKYYLPKLELNRYKYAGKFFGNKCYYLSEFDFGLVYTAPRTKMFSLNHHSIEGELHLGVELSPFFITYSLGAVYYIDGNSEGIPAGVEGLNTLRLGMEF